jgi:hypothetical protein
MWPPTAVPAPISKAACMSGVHRSCRACRGRRRDKGVSGESGDTSSQQQQWQQSPTRQNGAVMTAHNAEYGTASTMVTSMAHDLTCMISSE